MSEMVERVARALVIAKFGPEAKILFEPVPADFPQSAEAQAHFSRRIGEAKAEARAAIEAMREPTPAMILEATDCGRLKLGNGDFWRAIIDAALSKANPHSPSPANTQEPSS